MEKVEECKKWLKNYLLRQNGALVEETKKEAKKQGYNNAILKQARKELGVKTFHQFDEHGETPNWFWHL